MNKEIEQEEDSYRYFIPEDRIKETARTQTPVHHGHRDAHTPPSKTPR